MRRHVPLVLVLFVGTTLSSLVFQMKKEAVTERQRAIFSEWAYSYFSTFQSEIELHINALESLRDLTLASPGIAQEEFALFADATLERAPALKSLKWIPLRDTTALTDLETASLVEDFAEAANRAGEGDASDEDPREVSSEAQAGETDDQAGDASETLWDSTVGRAKASGTLAASKPMRIREHGKASNHVVLVLPVISKEGGEDHTLGFAGAVLDLDELWRNLGRAQDGDHVNLQLFDNTEEDEAAASIFASNETTRLHSTSRHDAPFSVGGRDWVLSIAREGSLTNGENLEAWSLLAGGLTFTLFVAFWTRQRQEYIRSVETKVNQRTSDLSRINADLQNEMAQRRQAEIDLLQSETRFREAFLHAPVGIALLSPQGKWIQVNEALVQMTGFSEEELYQRTLAEMLHPDEVQQQLAHMAQMLAGELDTFALEGPFRHQDGHFLSVLMNVSQVRNEDHQLLYFICQILDVSRQTQALEETRRAKEFSENIIGSSIDGIFAFDMDGNVTVWNSGMEEMTGITEKEALGRSTTEVRPFLMETGTGDTSQHVLAGETVRVEERPFSVLSSGRSGFFSGNYAPLHGDHGEITGGVAVVRDVTEERKARERLQTFTELLKQRNRELQDFAYVASHDLQEPLRKIRAFGDRLVAKCDSLLDDQARDYLKRMQDASLRMQTLIHDLLAFSRISTETHPFASVDLSIIVREVLDDLESRIEETGARVEIGDLPTLEADPSQIRQLLQNLIGNGLKYHRADTPPHIRVHSTPYVPEEDLPPLEREACLLYVEDNGIGFEEKYLDRIFTVFQRLHGRGEYPGTGVGLAICRKIAERHDGWISARSVPGKGSTFITALPYKQRHRN